MMGATTAKIEKAAKCAAAIAVAFTVVKFGADDDTVALATASSDKLLGVAQHPTLVAGEPVRVMMDGISKAVFGGTVTRGDRLTVDSQGRVISASTHTHTENTAAAYTQNATTGSATSVNIIGVAMCSGVVGDIGLVLISQGMI